MSLVKKIAVYIGIISLISYISVLLGNEIITKKEIQTRIIKEYYDIYKIYKATMDEHKQMLKNGIYTPDITISADEKLCFDGASDFIVNRYLTFGVYKNVNNHCEYDGIYVYRPLNYLSKLEDINWLVVLDVNVLRKLYPDRSFWDNYVGNKIITKTYSIDDYSNKDALSIFLYSKINKIISYKVENIGNYYYLIMEIPVVNVSGIELGNIYIIKNISWIYEQEHKEFMILTVYGMGFTSILLIMMIFIISHIIKDIKNLLIVATKLKDKDFMHLEEVEQDPILTQEPSKLNEISKLKQITYAMAIEIKKLVGELEKDKERFKEMAYKDPLTGIYNRRFFFEEVKNVIEQSKRANTPIYVAIYDIDNFKKVNDTYGHDMGDVVIKDFAKVIQNTIRKSDIPARFGGEEFVVLFYNTTVEDAYKVADKIRTNFEASVHELNGVSIKCTCSGGLAEVTKDDTVDSAIKKADEGLYVAKRSTKNVVIIYKEEDKKDEENT